MGPGLLAVPTGGGPDSRSQNAESRPFRKGFRGWGTREDESLTRCCLGMIALQGMAARSPSDRDRTKRRDLLRTERICYVTHNRRLDNGRNPADVPQRILSSSNTTNRRSSKSPNMDTPAASPHKKPHPLHQSLAS